MGVHHDSNAQDNKETQGDVTKWLVKRLDKKLVEWREETVALDHWDGKLWSWRAVVSSGVNVSAYVMQISEGNLPTAWGPRAPLNLNGESKRLTLCSLTVHVMGSKLRESYQNLKSVLLTLRLSPASYVFSILCKYCLGLHCLHHCSTWIALWLSIIFSHCKSSDLTVKC